MHGFNFQSLFSEDPERQLVSGPGASGDWRIKPRSLMDEDADPRFPAFQQAWKRGAGLGDLFGPEPFKLQGTVAPSGGDNTRADVAKVQTLLGKAGYLDLGQDGPSGYANPDTDKAIRAFQQDNDLQLDGVQKPNGPTVAKLGGLLGGGTQSVYPSRKPQQWPSDPVPGNNEDLLIRLAGGKPEAQSKPPAGQPDEDGWDPHGGRFGTGGWKPGYPKPSPQREGNMGWPWRPKPEAPVPAPQPGNFGIPGDLLAILTGEKPFPTTWPLPTGTPTTKPPAQQAKEAGGPMADLAEGARTPSAPANPFGSAEGADRWEAGNMARALLGKSDYQDAITHFKGEVAKDRGRAMPYLAAVHQEMAGKNPEQAGTFAMQMSEAGLTDEQEDFPDDGKIHIRLGPPNLPPEEEQKPANGGGDGTSEGQGGNEAQNTGHTDPTDTDNGGSGEGTQEVQIASTGEDAEGGSDGAEGQSEGHQTPDLEKFKEQAIGRGKGYGTGHCVDLVRTANPDLPRSTEWQEGSKIKGAGNPPLKPGTTIATFDPDGKYHGERRTGQHAAVFLEYTTENGKPGMMVLDQWLGQPPHVRFIPFDDGKKRQNNAGSYSVIK